MTPTARKWDFHVTADRVEIDGEPRYHVVLVTKSGRRFERTEWSPLIALMRIVSGKTEESNQGGLSAESEL